MGVAKRRREVSAMDRCIHFPPFLIHVALVLSVGWIASLWSFNLPFVFTVGFAYLYYVEGRMKAKFESRIRSDERKFHDRKRLLSDAETARWLNSSVEAVWPIFMEKFASQRFLMPIAPWFLEKYKPGITKKVVLEKICLGRNPPVFTMLRCGRNPTDGDHLVLEMGMMFVAAGDMSAVIAVQMKKRVGFGIWTSLNISNVQIEGKLRVGVRFTSGWPVVERLRVSFSEAPILQMTAKPIFNYGIDVTDLPGVAGWVDKMIADALEQSLVEPNMLVVDVKNLVGSMMSVSAMVQPTSGAGLDSPGDCFSVMNPKLPQVGTLRVEIIDGKKMKPSDPNGKADPYVKLQLGSTKYTTSIKHKTLQPAWHETFEFPIHSWDQPNKLLLRVLDKDRFGHDDNMGFAEIDCQSFHDEQRHEMELILDKVKTGQLRVAIVYIPGAEKDSTVLDTPQSFNPEIDSSSVGRKLKSSDPFKGAPDSQTQVHDEEISETDEEECSVKCDTQIVDVGYGKPGAVSIVTPGKGEVKEATSSERLRRRRKLAVKKAEKMAHNLAHPSSPSGVADESRRSRLKTFFGVKGKHPSSSDSSGELVVIAHSDRGTVVQTTVEVNGEVCNVDKSGHIVPSSGELLQGSDEALDEVASHKGGRNKVQKIIHKIGRKATNVTSAIAKMRSPSGKKLSPSGKNLEEQLAIKGHDETHDVAKTPTTGEPTGDKKVILQHESPSSTQAQSMTVTVAETGDETDISEAETEDPLRFPYAAPGLEMSEAPPRPGKLRRAEGIRDPNHCRSQPAEKRSQAPDVFPAPTVEDTRVIQHGTTTGTVTLASSGEKVLLDEPTDPGKSPGGEQGEDLMPTVYGSRNSSGEYDYLVSESLAIGNYPCAEKSPPAIEPATASERASASEPCTSKPRANNGDVGRAGTHQNASSLPSPKPYPHTGRRGALRFAHSIGSSSAKSFFSRIHEILEGSTGRSLSSKELTTPSEDHEPSRAKPPNQHDHEEESSKTAAHMADASTSPVLEEELKTGDGKLTASAECSSAKMLLSRSNCLSRQSSYSPASSFEDFAPAKDGSSISVEAKCCADEHSSRIRHPVDITLDKSSSVKHHDRESHALPLSENTSSPRKNLGSSSHTALYSELSGFQEAIGGSSASATDAPPLHVAVQEALDSTDGGEQHRDIGNTSARHLLCRTKGFRQPGDAGSVPHPDSAPITETSPGADWTGNGRLKGRAQAELKEAGEVENPPLVEYSTDSSTSSIEIKYESPRPSGLPAARAASAHENPTVISTEPSREGEISVPTACECSSVQDHFRCSDPPSPSPSSFRRSDQERFLDPSSRSPNTQDGGGSTSAKSFFSRTKGFRQPSGHGRSLSATHIAEVPEAAVASWEQKSTLGTGTMPQSP